MRARGAGLTQAIVVWIQNRILGASRHWLTYANLFWGVLFGLPWLAPVLMAAGATSLVKGIYSLHSYLCHQLANRSFFLFGPKSMYSPTELLGYVADADTPWDMRAVVGAPELGYKVAWSDRSTTWVTA